MYLKKVRIKNVKCFSEIELDFASRTELEIRRWTALLGENGLGKTTLLRAIGAALAGPAAIADLLSPMPTDWVRLGEGYGEIYAELLTTPAEDKLPPNRPKTQTPYYAQFIVPGQDRNLLPATFAERYDNRTIPQEWSGEGTQKSREQLTKDMTQLKKTAYTEGVQGWLACGYGPFRRLSGGSETANSIVAKEGKAARFVTLFHESAALTNVEQWLLRLDYRARDDETSQRRLEVVKRVLRDKFLPAEVTLHVDSQGAKLQIDNQGVMAFSSLSDGYRSMLALGVDLLRWLTAAFPDDEDPTGRSGVVLIDELDVHLHPTWQRQIGFWLLEKFPKLQFIVATHSPFLAQVADEPAGNVLLQQTETGVKSALDLESASDWRVDQILRELFELDSVRSPETERKLKEYQALRLKRKASSGRLDKAEEDLYQRYEQWVGTLSDLDDPQLRRLSQHLQQLVEKDAARLKELE